MTDKNRQDAFIGQLVEVDGKRGHIVSFPGQYVGVRFVGERHVSVCHPLWRIRYLGTKESV